MSDKYIIRNCPTLMGNRLCYGKTIKQCADCTDCLLKRIVKQAGYCLCPEILELLDIQEVE